MPDLKFQWGSDERDVLRSIRAMGSAQSTLRDQIQQLAETSRAAGEEDLQLAQKRVAALNEITGRQQELQRESEKLQQELREGNITADQYKDRFEQLGRESHELRNNLRQLGTQIQQDGEDMRKGEEISRRYESTLDQLKRRVGELNRLHEEGRIDARELALAVQDVRQELLGEDAAAEKATRSSGRLQAGFDALAAGSVATVAMLREMAAALKEMRGEMTDATVEADKMFRQFGIQAGLTPEEREQQGRAVGQVALEAAVELQTAFDAATQLSSSGFEDPVQSGTLNTALALMQSSNQIEGDPTQFIKGSAQFLSAFGMDKNQQNLANLGIRLQGLFKTTDVQVPDLSEFAKAAPAMQGAGLSLEDSLSVLTSLRETMSPGEAATGARNVISLLQTAVNRAPAREALETLNLRGEDVDLQGEDIATVLQRLQDATADMGDAEQAQTLDKIFGRENVGAARILMGNAGRLQEFGQMQRNAAVSFDRDVMTARSGISAARTREDVAGVLHTLRHAEFTADQDSLRLVRQMTQDTAIKDAVASNTLAGSAQAAWMNIGRMVDDNIVRPLIGESFGATADRRDMADIFRNGADRTSGVQIPDELTEVMKKQNEILLRIERKQANNVHAGNAGGRAANQTEKAAK